MGMVSWELSLVFARENWLFGEHFYCNWVQNRYCFFVIHYNLLLVFCRCLRRLVVLFNGSVKVPIFNCFGLLVRCFGP